MHVKVSHIEIRANIKGFPFGGGAALACKHRPHSTSLVKARVLWQLFFALFGVS